MTADELLRRLIDEHGDDPVLLFSLAEKLRRWVWNRDMVASHRGNMQTKARFAKQRIEIE